MLEAISEVPRQIWSRSSRRAASGHPSVPSLIIRRLGRGSCSVPVAPWCASSHGLRAGRFVAQAEVLGEPAAAHRVTSAAGALNDRLPAVRRRRAPVK